MEKYFKRSMLVASIICLFGGIMPLVFLESESFVSALVLLLMSYGFFRVYRHPEKNFEQPFSKWTLLLVSHIIAIAFLGGLLIPLMLAFK